jgi:hypothetical protein
MKRLVKFLNLILKANQNGYICYTKNLSDEFSY